jgi:AcrR family transcriptional regulator
MATHAERRAGTQAAVMKAARKLFGERGFASTSVDDIAAASRVAKGAIYHYFQTKNDLFEAVLEQASSDLVREIDGAVRSEKDTLAALASGTQLYFAKCARGPMGQIILRDGPPCSVGSAGARSMRSISAARFPRALNIAMDAGIIARQPVEPLARLLLGAISEAAAACAGRSDIEIVGADYARAFRSLLDALRRR